MRSVLLATVAAAALAFAPFIASAQDAYGANPAPPATTSTTTTDTAAPAYDAPADPAAAPSAADPNTAENAPAAPADTMQSAQSPAPDAADQAFAQPASAPSEAEMQLARDAGLAGVPMTAQDVCAQRTVTLADHEGMTRTQKVENAVDRASVCRVQAVVINAPTAEANRLKRVIVAQGVPEEAITMQRASASDATVQMSFNGVATSSAQYSALFNPNYAANSYGQSTQSDAGAGYAPSSAPGMAAPSAPAAPASDMNAPEAAPDAAAPATPETTAPSVPTQPQY
jgi:hypothetical protein